MAAGPCSFSYRPYRVGFRTAVRTAQGWWREREGVIVRLEGEDGEVGWAEAAPVPHFGMESAEELVRACAGLPRRMAEEEARVGDGLPTLAGALVRAFRELEERRRDRVGKPADARGADYCAVAALLPAGAAGVRAVAGHAENGFRAFKWKVGVEEPREEWGMLDELCAALPAGAKLRLDANGAWDRRTAQRWMERCAERPVEFVEQPIAADARGARDTLVGLAGDYPTPIGLDESLVRDGDVKEWLGAGWPGVYVVKPSLLADTEGVLARLRAAGAPVVFSSALETAVGARTALRAALGWEGERRALGFGVWPLFERAVFDGPALAPFVRRTDVEALRPEAVWNALEPGSNTP